MILFPFLPWIRMIFYLGSITWNYLHSSFFYSYFNIIKLTKVSDMILLILGKLFYANIKPCALNFLGLLDI